MMQWCRESTCSYLGRSA